MTRITNLTDYLRVEVEQPPAGLRNLLANPSGTKGPWAWIATVGRLERGTLTGPPVTKTLRFVTAASTTGPQSEDLPVTPGEWIAGLYDVTGLDTYIRAFFRFYNAAGAVVSSSTPHGLTNGTGRKYVPTVQVPATAAMARLTWEVSSTTPALTAPAAGKVFNWVNATVATATTAAALGPTYTNLITNPSLEAAATGWAATGGATLTTPSNANLATAANLGAKCLRVTKGTASLFGATSPEAAVVAGRTYSACLRVGRSDTRVVVRWYNAAHALMSSTELPYLDGTVDPVTGAVWKQGNVVPPALAAYARIYAEKSGRDPANWFELDAAMIAEGVDLTYFDGSVPDVAGEIDYRWEGAIDLSSSVKALSQLPFIEPITYQEVMGSAVALRLARRAFDGTLSVTIRDATLDPAQVNLLRPGRAVRVLCRHDKMGVTYWDELFQGSLQVPLTDYGDLKRNDRPTVTLTAYGPGVDLVAAKRADGYATLQAVPELLEGVRLPYSVDGDVAPNPAWPALVQASTNADATVLDQVILARDSCLGYAWVSADGTLHNLTDRTAESPQGLLVTYTEADYTGLAVTFDPATCINMVTVVLLRHNAATGETEEVTYGPYVDEASRREWGPQPAEFRVHGIADVPAYAAAILAANATPQLAVASLRLSIQDVEDLGTDKALIDLYRRLQVIHTGKGIDATMRVQGIDHAIDSRGRWHMDLTFAGDDTVATPTATTPLPPGGGVLEGVWYEIGTAGRPPFANGWSNTGGANATAAYMKKNGLVHLKGTLDAGTNASFAFNLPAGFRPAANRTFAVSRATRTTGGASAGTAHTHDMAMGAGRVVVTSGGNVTPQSGTGTQSLDGIVFPAEA